MTAKRSDWTLTPPANPGFQEDEKWMRRALSFALKAFEAGEVPVGAVLLRGKQVLAETCNVCEQEGDAMAHAEILALQEGQKAVGDWRLTECTLYVTKEPCPMCAGAILNTRLGRLVFGMGDDKAGACGGATDILRLPHINHRVEVLGGVLGAEALSLLQQFFREARMRRRSENTGTPSQTIDYQD